MRIFGVAFFGLFCLRFVEGFHAGSDGKGSACRRPQLDPWVGKIPWRREWQPTPVFLPGEFHEQRSPAGYSPWGHKELDMGRGDRDGEHM